MRALRRAFLGAAMLGAALFMHPAEAPCVDCPAGKPCFSNLVCRPRFCPDLSCRIVNATTLEKRCIEVRKD